MLINYLATERLKRVREQKGEKKQDVAENTAHLKPSLDNI